MIFLLLLGAGAAAVWATLRTDKPAAAPSPRPCAVSQSPAPAAAAAVRVRVLNSTNRAGLAAAVAAQLRQRGYLVTGVGNEANAVSQPAQVRYGPHGVNAARIVLAVVPGAIRHPDRRTGRDIDLVLGNRFTRLAPVQRPPARPSPSSCASPKR